LPDETSLQEFEEKIAGVYARVQGKKEELER